VLSNAIGVLFDGIAYGSLLFLISVGLSVTMGLMNFDASLIRRQVIWLCGAVTLES